MPNVLPIGIDDDPLLADALGQRAASLLTERAKKLTVGDTWRFQGWALDGDAAPNEDSVLKQLDMEDMKSVARALEQHLREKGNNKGWKYVSPTYACGACCFCAVVVPPDMNR